MSKNKAIGIGLVVAGAFAYYFVAYLGASVVGESLSTESASSTFAYLLGSLIGAALLSIPISFIPALRTPDSKYLIAGTLFFAIIGSRAYEQYVEVDQAGSYMSTMRELVDENILEGRVQDRDFSVDEYGEMAPLLELLTNMNAEAVTIFEAVDRQIDLSRIESIFDPQTYTSQTAIDATLFALVNTKTVIEQSRDQHLALYDDMPGRIAELPMGQWAIDQAVRGYNGTADESKAIIAFYYDVENRTMDKFIEITEFLATHPHEFSEVGQWLFGTDEDVTTFNTYAEEVARLADQEEAALSRFQERNLELRDLIPPE